MVTKSTFHSRPFWEFFPFQKDPEIYEEAFYYRIRELESLLSTTAYFLRLLISAIEWSLWKGRREIQKNPHKLPVGLYSSRKQGSNKVEGKDQQLRCSLTSKCTPWHRHAHTSTHTHTHTCAHENAHISTYIHTYMHTCKHTHISIHTHQYTHTHQHIHTYTYIHIHIWN